MKMFSNKLNTYFWSLVIVLVLIYCYFIRNIEKQHCSQFQTNGKLQRQFILPESLVLKSRETTQGFHIPQDEKLHSLNEVELARVYWRYVNTIQVLCREQTRLGSFRDGGKEICLDSDFIPKKPCLVYSFGSNFQFDFELSITRAFGCDVHTFDPTMEITAITKRKIPKEITFHQLGFAGHDHITEDKHYEMATLETIKKRLSHINRTVDLLKIDIEGWEWPALDQAVNSVIIQSVKQLQIEFHYEYSIFENTSVDKLQVLRGLYDQGFRIFMRERNLVHVRPLASEYANMYTPLVELSLINIHYLKE